MKNILLLAALAALFAGCSKEEPYVNHCKGCLAKGLARCVHCDAKGWPTCHCGAASHSGPGAKEAMKGGAEAAAPSEINGVDFTYAFVEPPKVGEVILKLQTDDPRKPHLKAFAHYDMPSMRGAHDTTVQFRLNKKGDFVIPIHFAMPGDWEIVVTFKDEKDAVVGQKIITLDI